MAPKIAPGVTWPERWGHVMSLEVTCLGVWSCDIIGVMWQMGHMHVILLVVTWPGRWGNVTSSRDHVAEGAWHVMSSVVTWPGRWGHVGRIGGFLGQFLGFKFDGKCPKIGQNMALHFLPKSPKIPQKMAPKFPEKAPKSPEKCP